MKKEQELEKLYEQYQYAIPDFAFFIELVKEKETKQEQINLLQRVVIGLIQEGNKNVRKRFVEQNLGLIVSTAKKLIEQRTTMDGNFIEIGDLCQEGYLVFEQCLDRFDLDRDTMFSTYVVASMQYRMQNYLRHQTNPLYVSDYQYEKGLLESRPYSYISLDRSIQGEQKGQMEEFLIAEDNMEHIMKSVDIYGTLKQMLLSLSKTEQEFFVWHYIHGLPNGQFQYHHNFTSNKVSKLNRSLQKKLVTNPLMCTLRDEYFSDHLISSNQKVKTK